MLDDRTAVIGEGDVFQLNIPGTRCKGTVGTVQLRDIGDHLQAIQLIVDLARQECAVAHSLQLRIYQKGGHQKHQAVGKRKRSAKIQGNRQKQQAAAGELEYQGVKFHNTRGAVFLFIGRLPPALKSLIDGGLSALILKKSPKHRDAADILQHLRHQLFLCRLHPRRVNRRPFLNDPQYQQTRRQPRKA